MYLTYQEYQDLGFSKAEESTFNKFESKARRLIRYHTMNRVEQAILGDSKGDIQECMCLLVDNEIDRETALKQLEQGLEISRKGIVSESVTDHSTSFDKKSEEDVTKLENEYKKQAHSIIRECLLWTGLLYRGL